MLENNVWDAYGENDEHIVSHDKHTNQFVIEGDSCKKSIRELHGFKSIDYVSSYDTCFQEELLLLNLTWKERMLEKGSWSNTPEGVFSCDSDSCEELKRLTSDDTGMSDHCFKRSNIDSGGNELCADDTLLGDKCVMEDDSVCQYPINHISQADNELSFLDNDGWLDIGNFEDVDRMLSSDLTFGMGSLNNEEEFSWLSSSQGAEGSDDALKSDFKFSCAEMTPLKSLCDYNMDSKENMGSFPLGDSNQKAPPADKKVRSQMDVDDGGVPSMLSVFSESETKSGNAVELVPNEKLQRKMPKSSAGRWKKGCLENGDSIQPYSSLDQCEDIKQPFGASSSGVTSLDSIQKQNLSTDSESLGCMQMQIPIMPPDLSQNSNQTSLLQTLSGSRSDQSGHLSASVKDSSYASNMESSPGHSLEAAALKTEEKREKLSHCHVGHTCRGVKSENMPNQMPFHTPGLAQQVVPQFENENEGHSEVQGVSLGFSPEIDSSTVQESSSMSSALNQASLEATSFCQLQQVMDQLDIRTKLCIRDSLYRLAKSAEQRHNDSSANGCNGDDVEACKAMMAQNGSRCPGFMDMETDTNPIDRSIAHLLFHRPSDPSTLLPNDTIPSKSSAMVHGSVINSPVKTEKQVFLEDSSTGEGKKSLGDYFVTSCWNKRQTCSLPLISNNP